MRFSGGAHRVAKSQSSIVSVRRAVWIALSVATLLLVPQPARAAGQTVVSLTFDDGTVNQYNLAFQRALAPHNVDATFFVNTGNTGKYAGYMTWDQLSAINASGSEIAGHTLNHVDLTSSAYDYQTKVMQVCDDRQALLQHGFNSISFAYPYGAYNQTAKDIVRACGYGNARGTGGVSTSGPVYAETMPPPDFFATLTWTAPTPSSSPIQLADMQAVVNAAAAHGGGWVQIVIHRVCSQQYDSGDYSDCLSSWRPMELDTINAFLDWLQNAGQTGGAPAETVTKTVRDVAIASDTIAPTTSMSCNGAACSTSSYASPVTVTLVATDTGSGVASTHYTTDGSDPTLSSPTYTGPFSVSETTTVKFRSYDNAGNAESTRSQLLQIGTAPPSDTTPPTTTISCNGAPCSTNWYASPVTVTLVATDTGSGVASTHYTTDGSDPTLSSPTYTGPFSVSETTTVKFRSYDNAGNAEPVQSQLVRIDAAAPTASISKPLDGSSFRRGARVVVGATATDAGTGAGAPSGVARVRFDLDGTNLLATDTTSPYEFTWQTRKVAVGPHTLTAVATDVAGNSASSTPITVYITN